jgi:hypothetical protein
MNGHTKDWAFGVLIAAALGMGGFTLRFCYEMNARMAVHERDEQHDVKQDKTLSSHWRIHSWTRDRITELRTTHGLPVVGWPDLD